MSAGDNQNPRVYSGSTKIRILFNNGRAEIVETDSSFEKLKQCLIDGDTKVGFIFTEKAIISIDSISGIFLAGEPAPEILQFVATPNSASATEEEKKPVKFIDR